LDAADLALEFVHSVERHGIPTFTELLSLPTVSLSLSILQLPTHLLLRKYYLAQKKAGYTMLIDSYIKHSRTA
jgi:hypothetical protein